MNNEIDTKKNNRYTDPPDAKETPSDDTRLDGNVTPDKPDHPGARASVFVEGLSVLGFNPATNRAEFGFFKDMHFPIEMKIFNSECELVWSTERDFSYSTFGIVININTTKEGMGRRYESDPMDEEDFRNLPDLAKWHGAAELNVTPDPKNVYLSARLNIYDAVFYTYKMSVNQATRYESDGVTLRNPVQLGRIGRIPGGDIFCLPTDNLEIEIFPLNVPAPVRITLGNDHSPYIIIVRAEPSDPHNHTSHLVHLYNVLERPPSDTRTFAMQFDGDEPPCLFCGEITAEATQFECQVFIDSKGGW